MLKIEDWDRKMKSEEFWKFSSKLKECQLMEEKAQILMYQSLILKNQCFTEIGLDIKKEYTIDEITLEIKEREK